MARPKGSRDKHPRRWPIRFMGATIPSGKTPLEYMLAVMNDETADMYRRDNMARAAAPFIHARIGSDDKLLEGEAVEILPSGKKARKKIAANRAGEGTEWGDDLKSEVAN